jgi:SAM-dependent methyltransferase
MAEFDGWAEFYDLVHAGLPGEAEFYLKRAMGCGGDVLELACGTGRVAISVARSGLGVVGLDLSRPMLERCEIKWSEARDQSPNSVGTLELVHDDMRTFDLKRRFDRIIMPYRSFMHLLRPEDQLACLERVAAHLEPDGRFIMNMWIPSVAYIYAFSTAPPEQEYTHIDTYSLDGSEDVIEHYHSVRCDVMNQLLTEAHRLITLDIQEKEVARTGLPLQRAWISVREMQNLIAASPLEIEALYGGFDESAINAESTESVWVLKKRIS